MRAPRALSALPLLGRLRDAVCSSTSRADPSLALAAAAAASRWRRRRCARDLLARRRAASSSARWSPGSPWRRSGGRAAPSRPSAAPRWFDRTGQPRSPVLVDRCLREDAALTPTGVSRRDDVDHRDGRRRRGVRTARGAASAVGGWHAGRRGDEGSGAPAVGQVPRRCASRPLSQSGRAGRARRSRGAASRSSDRSRARRWSTSERALSASTNGRRAFRAWVRSALAATSRAWSERSAGVRRDRDRRSHRPAPRTRRTAAGGGHVSRHRHLRRQHRDSDAVAARREAGAAACRRVRRCASRSSCCCSTVASPGLRRPSIAPSPPPSLFLSGGLLELRGPSLNVLAVAGVLGLAPSPCAVFDPGSSCRLARRSAF